MPAAASRHSRSAADDPPLPDFDTSAFPDAIRLTNGTVNLIVIPSIGGRIMRYGFVGKPNVLWNNPKITDLPANASQHFNYGGDKAWPWPQDDWPLLIGRQYPPPPECDQAAFKSRLIGSHGVRLESPPIPSHAARLVREITLDPTARARHDRDAVRAGRRGAARRRRSPRGASRRCRAMSTSTRG